MGESKRDAPEKLPVYDTFDDFLRFGIREFYTLHGKTRPAQFVALLIASGQVLGVVKDSLSGEKGLKKVAIGAGLAVALRIALKYALSGPLGILLTAATAASLLAVLATNQRTVRQKLGVYREVIQQTRLRYDEIQGGYSANRYPVEDRNLMIDGLVTRFLADLDEA
jgi:hypothetical protein